MADKTANKSRFFRVAVEGATASDGRTIKRAWLEQAAEPTESAIDKIANAFARALGIGEAPRATTTVVQPAPVLASTQGSAENTQLATALKEFSTQIGKVIQDGQKDANARFSRLETQFNALKTDLENTPESTYRTRPLHAGGDGVELTDC